jgi:hypothetical protein
MKYIYTHGLGLRMFALLLPISINYLLKKIRQEWTASFNNPAATDRFSEVNFL